MSALDAFIIANHNWLAWVIPLVLLGLVKNCMAEEKKEHSFEWG